MTGERVIRRLAAILAADVVGYSRLMGRDESGTLAALKALRRTVVDPAIDSYNGRIVKTTGDGLLVEFPSVVDAVHCVIKVQTEMAARGADVPEDRRIAFRVGVNLGDIIIDGDDIFGDGVNIAARLEAIAEAGGICLSDDAVRQIRGKIDLPLESLGMQALKNITEPVHVWRWSPVGAAAPAKTQALPDKPSIAVLPFNNMSGDPEQEYFVDGLVEDIITALSRFRSLFVIARNSSFTFKGKAVDIKQVGRALGVRYVLEGSVRKAGGRLRITGQLIDSTSGAHLWADHFDGALADVFGLQDRVTSRVVGAIVPSLNSAELARAIHTPVENLAAYDCFLRGAKVARQFTPEACAEALRLYYRAIELAPDFPTPYGMATHCYSTRKLQGWDYDPRRDEPEVRRLAERVSALGQNDAWALCTAGFGLAWICQEYETAAQFGDRATQLNPNLASAWINSGSIRMFRGEHDQALEQFAHVKRISPLGVDRDLLQGYAATSHLLLGNYEEAARSALDAVSHLPTWLVGPLIFSAAHGYLGTADQARFGMDRLRRLRPELRLSNVAETMTWRRSEDVARLNEGLRLAGLPE